MSRITARSLRHMLGIDDDSEPFAVAVYDGLGALCDHGVESACDPDAGHWDRVAGGGYVWVRDDAPESRPRVEPTGVYIEPCQQRTPTGARERREAAARKA